jgi:hypothetical protein
MGNTWITDMTHFLDEAGELASGMPRRAELLVIHFGRIVASVVEEEWGTIRDTGVPCRRRPGRKPCPGTIFAEVDPESIDVRWECTCCDDNGLILNWQAGPWDPVLRDIQPPFIVE